MKKYTGRVFIENWDVPRLHSLTLNKNHNSDTCSVVTIKSRTIRSDGGELDINKCYTYTYVIAISSVMKLQHSFSLHFIYFSTFKLKIKIK
jgi:hypothetical protein